MVKTGYISFITQIDGGFDSDGNINPSVTLESEFYACNLMVITKEYKVLVEQTWQQASFSCYIQTAIVPDVSIIKNCRQIRLKDNNSNYLGTYQVQNVEYLNLSKRIKLVV